MQILRHRLSALAVVLLSFGTSSVSQEVEPHRFQTGFSVGLAHAKDRLGLMGMLELSSSQGQELFGAHFFTFAESFPHGGDHGPSMANQRITGLALTYGRSHAFTLSRPLFPLFPIPLLVKKETDYQLSASVGVSLNRSVFRDGPERAYTLDGVTGTIRDGVTRVGVGIPVQVELVQMFTPSIGYVHRIYGNINAAHSMWGLSWALQVGW